MSVWSAGGDVESTDVAGLKEGGGVGEGGAGVFSLQGRTLLAAAAAAAAGLAEVNSYYGWSLVAETSQCEEDTHPPTDPEDTREGTDERDDKATSATYRKILILTERAIPVIR